MLPLTHEKKLWDAGAELVIGVDEAGVGPLAGPVVAAAVSVTPGFSPDTKPLRHINDSKALSENMREEIFRELIRHPEISYSIARVYPSTIDRINILRATHLAMSRCTIRLRERSASSNAHLLIDGNRTLASFPGMQTAVIGGDGAIFSIAAASIIAKVHRDSIMRRLHKKYPGYGFARHKGYPTALHKEALRRHGPSPAHRVSFLSFLRDPQT